MQAHAAGAGVRRQAERRHTAPARPPDARRLESVAPGDAPPAGRLGGQVFVVVVVVMLMLMLVKLVKLVMRVW